MELEQVHIVRAQLLKGGAQVLPELRRGETGDLGGDKDLLPHSGEGRAHLLLAVGVGPGGIEVVDPSVHRPAEELGCFLFGDALDGQASKAVFLDGDAGASQLNARHKSLLSFVVELQLVQADGPVPRAAGVQNFQPEVFRGYRTHLAGGNVLGIS